MTGDVMALVHAFIHSFSEAEAEAARYDIAHTRSSAATAMEQIGPTMSLYHHQRDGSDPSLVNDCLSTLVEHKRRPSSPLLLDACK
jgi:hypothetical protein